MSEFYHSCVLIDKKPYCWGWNFWGNLGIGGKNEHALPVQPNFSRYPELANAEFSDIDVGAHNTCAIAKDKAYCWGNNRWGQLGINVYGRGVNGSSSYRDIPQKVYDAGAIKGVTLENIALGSYHVCALDNTRRQGDAGVERDARVFCWGNTAGSLGVGDGTKNERPAPVEIKGFDVGSIEELSVSYNSTIAKTTKDRAMPGTYIWGLNVNSIVTGDRKYNNLSPVRHFPIGIDGESYIKHSYNSSDSFCDIMRPRQKNDFWDFHLMCTGKNQYGQVGNGNKQQLSNQLVKVSDTWNYKSGNKLVFFGNNLQNVDDIYSIYLDLNRNGKKDANEICQITDKGDSQLTCLTPQNNTKGVYDIFLNNAIGATNTKIGSFEYK